jgi:hypothetical protein
LRVLRDVAFGFDVSTRFIVIDPLSNRGCEVHATLSQPARVSE